jgi:hypothetical protein
VKRGNYLLHVRGTCLLRFFAPEDFVKAFCGTELTIDFNFISSGCTAVKADQAGAVHLRLAHVKSWGFDWRRR